MSSNPTVTAFKRRMKAIGMPNKVMPQIIRKMLEVQEKTGQDAILVIYRPDEHATQTLRTVGVGVCHPNDSFIAVMNRLKKSIEELKE